MIGGAQSGGRQPCQPGFGRNAPIISVSRARQSSWGCRMRARLGRARGFGALTDETRAAWEARVACRRRWRAAGGAHTMSTRTMHLAC
eukprot:4236071-Prymnesium_polylepis.1